MFKKYVHFLFAIFISVALYAGINFYSSVKFYPGSLKPSAHEKFASQYKIAIIVSSVADGEYNTAQRLVRLINSLGWDCYIYLCNTKRSPVFYKVNTFLLRKFSRLVNVDLTLAMNEIEYGPIADYNYYFIASSKIPPTKRALYQYDGFLICRPNPVELEWALRAVGKNPLVEVAYYSQIPTQYQPLDYKRLFYCVGGWDSLRKIGYDKVYELLVRADCVDIYGPGEGGKKWRSAYKGFFSREWDGLRKVAQETGIGLALHSYEHHDLNMPSARVFEIVAEGMVAISDQHQFFVDNFGDSLLYVDHKAPQEVMAAQIKAHVDWVLAHPIEAEQKARRAHEIFVANFSLDHTLQSLLRLHERAQESSKGHPQGL